MHNVNVHQISGIVTGKSYLNLCIHTDLLALNSDHPTEAAQALFDQVDEILTNLWDRLPSSRVVAYHRFGTENGTSFLVMRMSFVTGERFVGEIFPRRESGSGVVELSKRRRL